MENSIINNKRKRKYISKVTVFSTLLSLMYLPAIGQDKIVREETLSLFSNSLFLALLAIALLLLIVIIILADVLKAAAHYKGEKEALVKNPSSTGTTLLTLLATTVFSNNLFSQTSAAPETASYKLDDFTFYFMITIILFESFVIWILYNMSMNLLGVKERKRLEAEEKARRSVLEPSFIEKINASVAVEKEADILLDHNYDGIRELDNNLPPWWKYGFYFTILFSVAYLIHYHVIDTGKLQQEEYKAQLTKAAYDIEAYRKKAANLVDENNATLLTDAASLNSGKSIYIENCAPCHGKLGEGGVGPNLTDAYWIHKGGIKDIFKTIKYGWAEKGMKPWKDDLGAKQIHEVASYIKLMYGTNPPNAKEKQGDLYQEEILNDSIKVAEKVPEHISEGQ